MILVTGHRGFIGRNLFKALQDQGHTVYGFDAVDGDPIELAEQVPWKDIEMIYHQGAISNTTELDVLKVQRWNVQSSVQIFEKAIKHKIPVKYASSGSVYGNSMSHGNYEYNPLNYYAISKLTVDMWVKENLEHFAAPINGFRYFNVYGADEKKSDFCTSPVYRFSEQAKKDGVIQIFSGSQNTYRDFVWVGDIINIITRTFDNHKIYDLGCGNPISFLDVAEIVSEKYNVPIKFIPFPEIIKGKYQKYSRAREEFHGYNFMQVKEFVNKYLDD